MPAARLRGKFRRPLPLLQRSPADPQLILVLRLLINRQHRRFLPNLLNRFAKRRLINPAINFLRSFRRMPCFDQKRPYHLSPAAGDVYMLATRSDPINRSRWRGERFWPDARRDAGRILAAALTEEQRRSRPKDPPLLLRFYM